MPIRVRALLEFLKEWAVNPPEWSQLPAVVSAQAAAPVRARKRAAVTRP